MIALNPRPCRLCGPHGVGLSRAYGKLGGRTRFGSPARARSRRGDRGACHGCLLVVIDNLDIDRARRAVGTLKADPVVLALPQSLQPVAEQGGAIFQAHCREREKTERTSSQPRSN